LDYCSKAGREEASSYLRSVMKDLEEKQTPPFKLQVCSDLHIEFMTGEKEVLIPSLTEPSAPYLALLGDIGVVSKTDQYENFLKSEAKKYKKVFVLAGNHEYYHGEATQTKKTISRICDEVENLEFMDKKSLLVDGVRILGCTLWSFIPPQNYDEVSSGLNDFRMIKISDDPVKLLDAQEFVKWHLEDLNWLKDEVEKAKKNNEQVIVLTHHAPLVDIGTSDPQFFGKPSNSAFCTDLKYLLGKPIKCWAYGHTHWFQDLTVNGTRVVSNPHGYVYGKIEDQKLKKRAYNSRMVLEL